MSDEPRELSREEEQENREPLLEWLQSFYSQTGDGSNVVIGYGIVVEVLTGEGRRVLHKLTSDAGGGRLPDHAMKGYADHLEYGYELDEAPLEEDDA